MSASNRTVKLFCPSLSKVAQLVARDDQRLDLGSIARAFGLDPATLKLNGHFISRGVDLIASSVTWKSLISFFSSRGLSTGTSGSGALVVCGKQLSKSGSKRAHDSVNEIPSMKDWGGKPLLEESNLIKKTKIKDFDRKPFVSNAFSLKRKQDDDNDKSSLKRLKVDGPGTQITKHACSASLSKTQFPCGVNTKRMRENGTVVPASCKKIR